MFGYININQKELTEESKKIYQVHVCGILCRLIDVSRPFLRRVQRTGKLCLGVLQFIQSGQQNDQKCQIIT